MVTLEQNLLTFHTDTDNLLHSCQISFQRTLRIPDDNQEYPLPPGLGHYPLLHVDDYRHRLPADWFTHGGVFFPMYQAEAMWISFSSLYPYAVKIGAGKINAVTGKAWSNVLSDDPQDYLVVPDQDWLDGFSVGKGLIRQFIAMPLGDGFTAEEQITGKAETGGLQICAYPMKKDYYDQWQAELNKREDEITFMRSASMVTEDSMGFAPGGLMRQKIYTDPHGIDAWDTTVMSRCFVHIINSEQFVRVTGCAPPQRPVSASDYTRAGLPWFDLYDHDKPAVAGAPALCKLDSVATKMIKSGTALTDNAPVAPTQVVQLKQKGAVVDGQW